MAAQVLSAVGQVWWGRGRAGSRTGSLVGVTRGFGQAQRQIIQLAAWPGLAGLSRHVFTGLLYKNRPLDEGCRLLTASSLPAAAPPPHRTVAHRIAAPPNGQPHLSGNVGNGLLLAAPWSTSGHQGNVNHHLWQAENDKVSLTKPTATQGTPPFVCFLLIRRSLFHFLFV